MLAAPFSHLHDTWLIGFDNSVPGCRTYPELILVLCQVKRKDHRVLDAPDLQGFVKAKSALTPPISQGFAGPSLLL